MIILGFDPGYAIVGYGVIEKSRTGKCIPLDYGAITTPKERRFPDRLAAIAEGVNALIEKYKPDAISVEELFFNTNITTGIKVAEARGVIIATAVKKVPELYEYTPLQIKQALTGNGRATKHQMEYMTMQMLGLKKPPKPDDAADALAAALTHAQTNLRLVDAKMN